MRADRRPPWAVPLLAADVALWSYAVTVEPRALASQSGYGTALIHQGRYAEAAWHRMIESYIERSYPQPIDWAPVERLESRPFDERIVEGPGRFAPCRSLSARRRLVGWRPLAALRMQQGDHEIKRSEASDR